MLGPNHHTFHVANQAYDERLSHAARIRMIQRDRTDGPKPFNREGHRLVTVRRLTAAVAVTALLAAGGVATVAAAPHSVGGGGTVLIR